MVKMAVVTLFCNVDRGSGHDSGNISDGDSVVLVLVGTMVIMIAKKQEGISVKFLGW